MKIEVESTELRNFLSYGNVRQRIDFLKGISLIVGKDSHTGRSNGSGKCVRKNTEIIIDFDNEEIRKLFLQFCKKNLT